MERRMREYGRAGFDAENGLQYNGGGARTGNAGGLRCQRLEKGKFMVLFIINNFFCKKCLTNLPGLGYNNQAVT